MSAEISRQATNGGARRPDAKLPPPQISPAAAARDRLDDDQFEKQAADFLKPTLARPALIAAAEVDSIRTGYGTGAGRLDVLVKVTNKRLDWYQEQRTGSPPFDPLTPGEQAKARAFFEKHSVRLADQPRVAPDNPIRLKAEADKLLANAKVDAAQLTRPHLTEMATQADLARNLAVPDQPLPAAAPVADSAPPVPLSAMLEIEYVSAQGYPCRLTLHAPSGVAALEQGGAAMAKLVAQKAQAPAPAPAVVVSAPAGPAAEIGEAPTCAIHKTPMEKRQGKNGSFWSCPKKLDDGSWCPYKPK